MHMNIMWPSIELPLYIHNVRFVRSSPLGLEVVDHDLVRFPRQDGSGSLGRWLELSIGPFAWNVVLQH